VVCYCAALPRIETATKVVILQHPRERDMAIGTARMASLCLPNAALHVGLRWDDNPALAAAIADPGRPAILLYPGPGARDILTEPPAGPVTLVVVDGTWSQAKTLVRDNPILHALPRYAFAAPEASHYRIRKEPREEYCSTIEAVMHALGALEGDPPKFRALLDPFHAMVDAQLAHQSARPVRRFRVAKPVVEPRTKLPRAFGDRFEDLVLVVGEANAWPYRSDATKPPDELVHLVALRPGTGEMFDRIAAPAAEVAPSTSFHCGITNEELRTGASRADVIADFATWSRPADITAAWGYYTPDLILAAGGSLGERLDLRFVAQRMFHRKLGSLEAFAASLGPEDRSPYRARRRLVALTQIVSHLRSL
jgi:DTW domain-containing protein YfiP